MKNIFFLSIFLLFIGFTSCTPQSISEDLKVPQACCGDDIYIPPPPPPPPPSDDN